MLHEHGLKFNTFFYFRLCAKFFIALFFFNFRDYCNDCSIEFCDHSRGCRAPGKKKCGNRNEQGHHFHRHKTSFTKIRIIGGGGGVLHFYLISISLDQLLVNACDVSYYRGMDAFHGHNLLFSTKYWGMLIFVLF